jgi:hypothetical protein
VIHAANRKPATRKNARHSHDKYYGDGYFEHC